MYARRIVADRWHDTFNDEEEIDAPTADILARLLDRLDARTHTLLMLQGPREAHMAIGGGNGQYIVYFSPVAEQFWNLHRRASRDGITMLTVGGQEGDYPSSQIVTKEEAWQAANFFLVNGSMAPDLDWKEG